MARTPTLALLWLLVVVAGCSVDNPSGSARAGAAASGATSSSPSESASTGSTGGVDLGEPPTTYDEGLAHVEAGTGEESARGFQTPSGNLHCVFVDAPAGVSCDLLDGRIPAEGVCDVSPHRETSVGRMELLGGEVAPLCNTDTIADGANTTIDYGTVVRHSGAVHCAVWEVGVTCVDRTQRVGFFLARGAYAVLT